jgi:hypothetical protein
VASQGGRPLTKADVIEGNEGFGPLAGDAVNAMYGLAGATTAYFGSQRAASGARTRFGLQIFGTQGVLELTTGYLPSLKYLADPAWSPGQSGAKWQDVSTAGIGKPEPLLDGKQPLANRLAVLDLIASVRENRQPKCSIYDGRSAIEMIVAVFESHRLGKPAALPLANRQNPLAML